MRVMLLSVGLACWGFNAVIAQPIVAPGSGWSDVTVVPAAIGDTANRYLGARCIARWGVVPYRPFADSILVSVLAFHGNGIEKVEFAVNNGTWVAVYDPIAQYWDGFSNVNLLTAPVSGGGEYVAKIRTKDFSNDAEVRVRARIYPRTAGQCRVLPDSLAIIDREEELLLFANAHGTYTGGTRYADSRNGNDITGNGSAGQPFATLQKAVESLHGVGTLNGGLVLLANGSYRVVSGSVPNTYNAVPVIVKAAPGADQDSVRINQQSQQAGWLITRFSLQDLTIALNFTSGNYIWGLHPNNQHGPQVGWWHNCKLTGPGADICSTQAGFTSSYVNRQIFTQVEMSGCNSRKMTEAWLVRGCYIHDCSDDVFNKAELVCDTRVHNHLQVCGQHSDLWQYYGGLVDNVIYFNLDIRQVRAQIWFPGATNDTTEHNIAMVNVLGAQNIGDAGTSRQHRNDHVLFWHCSWTTQGMLFSSQSEQSQYGQTRGCYFTSMGIEGTYTRPQLEAVADMRDNCFNTGQTPWGTNGLAGAPVFANHSGYDFHPQSGSMLHNHVPDRLVAVDLDHNPRSIPTAAGCYVGPAEVTGIAQRASGIRPEMSGLNIEPNPSSGFINIVGAGGREVVVYNSNGGVVARLISMNGRNPIVWDGTDSFSQKVPGGVYLVRANGQTCRVLLMR